MSVPSELSEIPFLSHLEPAQLADIGRTGRRRTVDAGQVVFSQGDAADGMYILLRGQVRIYQQDDQGTELELATRESGSFFGEMALLEDRPRSASVSAVADTEFLILDADTFVTLLRQSTADVALQVFSALSRMVREKDQIEWREELERHALQAEMEIERHRALSQMVAGVAHEINTPLGIVSTAASIIKNEMQTDGMTALTADVGIKRSRDDILDAIDLMERNIARAHKLTQDFKQLAVNQLTDVLERVNLVEAVKDTVGLFRASARQAKLDIEVATSLQPGESSWLGYPGHLSHVILNLLTNVERYAYRRGTGGRVEIMIMEAADRPEPSFLIQVRDFGKGIPPEDLSKVLEPFFTTGRSVGATGLGLAIVQNLVTASLRGSIDIDSVPGRGTTVSVRIPQEVTEPGAT